MNPIPIEWLSKVKPGSIRGIVCHWTAGLHYPSQFDKQHYHFLIDKDGKVHRGTKPVSFNAYPITGDYAAHTRNFNSGIIGLSLCCLGGTGVSERDQGQWPMTAAEWATMVACIAQLSRHYGFPIQRPTKADWRGVQSHAEVESNLGISQAGKWDFTVCHIPGLRGARAIGDRFRAEANALLQTDAPVSLMDERDTPNAVYPEQEVHRADEELITTNREAKEPLSGFRKVLGWVTGIVATVGSTLAGFGSWLAMLKPEVLIAVVVTLALVGTIIFALIWLFPRPIVIDKEK
jgi:hypothetical protein